MPLFLTVHTLSPESLTEERVREIARLGQSDPEVRGYRSFHSLHEGRVVWLLEAPNKIAVLAWCARVGLPVDGVTQLEMEGHYGALHRFLTTIPNRIEGRIEEILSDNTIQLIRISCGTECIYAAVGQSAENQATPAVGEPVIALIKAVNLWVEKEVTMQLSFPNQIKGVVTNIIKGPAMTLVYLDTPVGELVSALIAPAVERMNVQVGDEVIAVFKATDVSLAKE